MKYNRKLIHFMVGIALLGILGGLVACNDRTIILNGNNNNVLLNGDSGTNVSPDVTIPVGGKP